MWLFNLETVFGGSVLDQGTDRLAPFAISKRYGFVILAAMASIILLRWLCVDVRPLFKKIFSI